MSSTKNTPSAGFMRGQVWLSLGAVLLLIALFARLAESISERESLISIDNQVEVWLLGTMTPASAYAFNTFTILGSAGYVAIVTAVLALVLLWQKEPRLAATLALAMSGGGLLDLALKSIFHRPRPDFTNIWVHPSDFSFPSGHALMSVILYGFVAVLLAQRLAVHWERLLAVGIAALTVFVIGLSRLLLGAHFPSDVLAGWAAGGAWLIVSWWAVAESARRKHIA